MKLGVGLDIGGTKGTVCLVDGERWRVLEREQFPAPATCAAYLDRLRAATARLLSAAGGHPAAVAISCGGPLDLRTGVVKRPPHLPDWDDTPVAAIFREQCQCPAWLENDANAGALAEWYWGAGQGSLNLMFVTFGTGFGAGIIANGRLVAGHSGQAGEIGHLRLFDGGAVAYGKAGSVEAYCSGGGLAAQLRDSVRRSPAEYASLLAAVNGDEAALSCKTLVDLARGGDAAAQRLLNEFGRNVGRALALAVDLLNPELVVLGGIYPRARDQLETPILAGLREECLPLTAADVRIVPAALGEAIGDYACMGILRAHWEAG